MIKPFNSDTFWKRVNKSVNKKGCWEWTGAKSTAGYGQVRLDGKNIYTHRLVFMLHTGKDPSKMFICHKCDNPPCCNPEHLFIGTAKTNNADCSLKGRRPKGETHWKGILTEKRALEIRRLHSSGEMSRPEIAKKFSISYSTVYEVIAKKTWRHI